jgi:2,3-bisphosphoglycerate-independent phosphoglycerate mutase
MDMHQLTRELKVQNDSKMVLLVADGLGGLPLHPGGQTELETANTPNLDRLAKLGISGGSIPVKPGISPGSGPGHLGLFGYDPLHYVIGRGALEATGIGFHLTAQDVAIRCNFCTLDAAGNITDRRAGRISTDQSGPLAIRLREVSLPGVELFVEPVREHRFVVILRGEGLGGNVSDTDPQATGVPLLEPLATAEDSGRTAEVAAEFARQGISLLEDQQLANAFSMRGFSARPDLPTYREVYGLRAAAVAVYPMYKGLAKLVGMDVVGEAKSLSEQVQIVSDHWDDYDFFFVHFKYTDSTGEDGDFEAKVEKIEEFDAALPGIMDLKPTVTVVTGDHSTPSFLQAHSWHAVPTMIVADACRTDACEKFGETECLRGGLGQFEAKYLMPLMLANAGRLGKYGA